MDVRRLMELGMPGELAKELVSQINAAVSGVSLTAADIAFTPAGDIEATNVQDAIEELDAEKEVAAG